MNRRINWTAESERTFNQNLDYLTKEWDAVVLNSFFDRVDEVLELIRSNPELFPHTDPKRTSIDA